MWGADMSTPSSGRVIFESEGDVAVIVIDNPPVNAGSAAVRKGLVEAVRRLNASPDLKAAIVIGAGKTFISGSDIREFGKPIEPPLVPEVIAVIENSPKPIVAAISGAALGGGYEIALACDGRVALDSAVVGLPEVKLGLIPGAGGTQRLPRLVGMVHAIDAICSARRYPAREALDIGMIDAIVTDLRRDACAHAAALPGKRRLRDIVTPGADAQEIEAAKARARKSARGLASVEHALAAIDLAVATPIDEALKQERTIFDTIRTGEEALALRHLFFAERAASKLGGEAQPRALSKIGVLGGGNMGSGIAVALLGGGYEVIVVDTNADVLARARSFIDAQGGAGAQRATLSGDIEALASCDLIIEAVIEDMAVKCAVLAQLARVAPQALLASNTSYLDLNALAAATGRAPDVLGLHFFAPAHRMRLLEIVVGRETSAQAVATGAALARRIGKVAVPSGVGEGFIGNRIYNAYRRQCEFLVEDGASPEQVDAALVKFGFAMGPFAVSDMSGLDIAWAMRKRLAATRDPRARYSALADRLCEAGRFGRKTGKGWYLYAGEKPRPLPDPEVAALIADCRAKAGVVTHEVTDAEITQRALGAIVHEARAAIAEGIAARESDVDLVLVNGYGFPASKGGAMFWASRLPAGELEAAIAAATQAAAAR